MLLRTITTSLVLAIFSCFAFAVEPIPQAFLDTRISEKLGLSLEKDVSLTNSDNEAVSLNSLLNEKVILFNFVYYSCPRLCHFVTAALVDSIKELPEQSLKDLRIITLSFDHRDTVESAKQFKARYQDSLEKELNVKLDWDFYVGSESDVKRLADSMGFKYYYNETSNQYAHSSAVILTSASGVVSRYLYGIEFNPFDMKLSIIEAKKNKSLSSVDSILLFCYNYDPLENTYIIQSARLMKIGGAITVFVIILVILILKFNERKEER